MNKQQRGRSVNHKYLFEESCAVFGGLTDISDKTSYSFNLQGDKTTSDADK